MNYERLNDAMNDDLCIIILYNNSYDFIKKFPELIEVTFSLPLLCEAL